MSRISEFYGFQDKTFYRSVFKVCLPIAVQQTINFTLQLVDNIMVGSLGDTTIAAVALANQVSFVIMILNMGLCAAGTAFASQHWGRGDVPSIRRTLGLVLEGTGVMGILFVAPTVNLIDSWPLIAPKLLPIAVIVVVSTVVVFGVTGLVTKLFTGKEERHA